MIRRFTLFLAVTAALWVVLAIPVRIVAGDVQAIYAGAAFLVCAAPALGTLGWSLSSLRQNPHQQLIAALAGTAIRLFVVSALAWILASRIPFLRQENGFAVWVLVAYLCTLAIETVIALRSRTIRNAPNDLVDVR